MNVCTIGSIFVIDLDVFLSCTMLLNLIPNGLIILVLVFSISGRYRMVQLFLEIECDFFGSLFYLIFIKRKFIL